MQSKTKKFENRSKLLNMFSHEYLWTPTPIYYFIAMFLFTLAKKRWALKPYTGILFLSFPITCDYLSNTPPLVILIYRKRVLCYGVRERAKEVD